MVTCDKFTAGSDGGSGKSEYLRDKCYATKGTKNLFESSDAFINYVVDVMQIDPRGLEIHRIDNGGHYEPGNIEFLTKLEHVNVHVEMRVASEV